MAFAAGDKVTHVWRWATQGDTLTISKVETGRVYTEETNDNIHFFIPEGGWTGPYADEGKKRAPIPNFDSYSEQVRECGDTKIWSYYVIDDLLRAIGMKRRESYGDTAFYQHTLFEARVVMRSNENLALIRVLPRHHVPEEDCPLFYFATNDPSAKRVRWLIDHLREEVGKIIQKGGDNAV